MFQDLQGSNNPFEDAVEIPTMDLDERVGEIESDTDSGKVLLYPAVSTNFPFKTSDRLLDDIRIDLCFTNSQEHDILYSHLHNGVLKLPLLEYSRKRNGQPWSIGYLIDQVSLKTRYEYDSITCPQLNKVTVFMGVLCDQSVKPMSYDDLSETSIYHLKVTVKTRSHLERTKRYTGITHYHLVEKLHPYDEKDVFLLKKGDERLVDSAIYVSSDSNKLVCIEILTPEFSTEELSAFSSDHIKKRYLEACENFTDLDRDMIPTQAECFNTLFKIFKGPLNRQSSDDVLKTISAENKFLNSQLEPSWLTEKYGFQLIETTEEETGKIIPEFEPPDLTDYVNDLKVRGVRESYIRRCLELIFLGKMSTNLMPKGELSKNSKARFFNLYQTSISTAFWFHLLGESRDIHNQKSSSLDSNYHFMNLSVCHSYSDKDIIRNYETQTVLDRENVGVYYDSLSYVANTKGSYQLIAYCGRQNVVGKEALDTALMLFGIDSTDTDVKVIPDDLLISIYRKESNSTSGKKRSDLKNALRLLAKFKGSQKLKFYADYEPYDDVRQAYQLLEIDESVDNDVIQTAYTVRVSDSPGLKMDCDRALYTLAVSKRSMALFNFLVQECSSFQKYYSSDDCSYSDALCILQINENATDDVVLEVFQRKWNHEPIASPDQFLTLRAALMKLGNERNSKLINHYLDTGVIDIGCLPAGNWPTGLNNIGNTCYLNSLLQYYFSIAPLRQFVLDYQKTLTDFHLSLGNLKDKRRIGGREVSEAEVERSVQFVYQLRDLFNDMVHTKERFVTPRKELAYLAFAPSSVEVEFEGTSTERISHPAACSKVEIIDLTADNVAENDIVMTSSSPSHLVEVASDSTADNKITEEKDNDIIMTGTEESEPLLTSTRVAKISTDQLENALEMGRQQDVTECIGNVLFQLESASDPIRLDSDGEQYDLIKELFYGKLKQDLVPIGNPSKVRSKMERFVSLLVNVGEQSKDVYDALDLYFKDDVLQLEEDGEVQRTVSITELPNILQIQIQRVYYDRERFMPFKSIEPLPFGNKIYMDRYMNSTDISLTAKKNETAKLKEQLQTLKNRKKQLLVKNESGMTYKGSLLETKKLLESEILEKNDILVEDKEKVIKGIDAVIMRIDNELATIYQELNLLEQKIAHQFDEFKNFGYTLFAVFIHRGEASYGHYWTYIKDHKKNGIWRKYNDESVTEAPESEVFNFTEGNTATPYFLVYIKEGHEDEVEPLKRIVTE
ncbi:LAFE_0F03466g1_1 [Lachancea fermentati]|uniref:Ubiquitin carboxyl-terminal hydrolase 2 n=1 Tax=Lachancea fermentati TaxID=4955 RepID=A0A1G4MEE8_LACFM|nr:LAFE_0F03466g1_1 [Lachancea fermentati]